MQYLTSLGLAPGATMVGKESYHFCLWAPNASDVKVRLLTTPEKFVPMQAAGDGYYQVRIDNIAPKTRYFYQITSATDSSVKDRPDPASRLQPEGVHGPSELFEPLFDWQDAAWAGIP